MARAVQKRRLETRARLVAAAQEVIDAGSFEGLRVEQVVQQAGVAKGTFFAHFPDKDALMDLLIGARMDSILDRMVTSDPPRTAAQPFELRGRGGRGGAIDPRPRAERRRGGLLYTVCV